MMRMATETVTCYLQQKDESYLRQVIVGASWVDKSIAATTDKGLQIGRMATMRIPQENVPQEFSIHPDDLIVKGVCEAEISPQLPAAKLRRNYGAVTVQAVHDNRRGLEPHWKVEAV